jgi:hypothetical protein
LLLCKLELRRFVWLEKTNDQRNAILLPRLNFVAQPVAAARTWRDA